MATSGPSRPYRPIRGSNLSQLVVKKGKVPPRRKQAQKETVEALKKLHTCPRHPRPLVMRAMTIAGVRPTLQPALRNAQPEGDSTTEGTVSKTNRRIVRDGPQPRAALIAAR